MSDKLQGMHIKNNGAKYWYKDGKHHRTDGPAIVFADGVECWYQNGKLHREDGPAFILPVGYASHYPDGYCQYWLEGHRVEESDLGL